MGVWLLYPTVLPKRDDFAPEYGVLAGWDVWNGRTLIKIINRAECDPEQKKLYERCQGALAEAEYTIVLGFGYDPTNCKRLGLGEIQDKHVFSTDWDPNAEPRPGDVWSGSKLYTGSPREDCNSFLLRTKALYWAYQGFSAAELCSRLKKAGRA
jgi:hypothetical protein